jgi:hypothetical protein
MHPESFIQTEKEFPAVGADGLTIFDMKKPWWFLAMALPPLLLAACSPATPIVRTVLPGHVSTSASGDICPGTGTDYITDFQIRSVPAMTEPAAQVPFHDPVFGTCLVRVTDRRKDLSAGDASAGLKNEYSRVESFNSNGSRILVRGTEATWYVYDAATFKPLGQVPIDIDPRWSAVDPDLLYYSSGTRLMSYNIVSSEQTTVHEFAADLPGFGAEQVWTRYEGSPSADGGWWGLMAQDADGLAVAFLVYDLNSDSVPAVRDLRRWGADAREIDSVTMTVRGIYFLAFLDKACPQGELGTDDHPCGLMAYDRSLTHGRGLLRIVGHADTALDRDRREVLVYQDIDTDSISVLDLETGKVTRLWEIDFTHCRGCGMHFSGRAFRRPGWALVSSFDGDPASSTWMDDQVFAVELQRGGRVVRLAHHHSLADPDREQDYWAEPQASVNWDFTRVLFTSNWGRSGSGEVEMYMILLPGLP